MHLPPRWVTAISLGVAAAILGDSFLYAVLPTQWPQLGLDVTMVGFLLSINRFVRMGSNPIAGWAMHRWGVRRPFMLAVFAAAGTTLVYASGLGFYILLLSRALWGVCWSFLRLGGYLVALEAASGSNRGYYLGFFNAVVRFGSFIATLTGGLLTDLLGFTSAILVLSGATILSGIGLLRERPSQPLESPVVKNAAKVSTTANIDNRDLHLPQASDSERGNIFYRNRLWVVYAATFCNGLVISGLTTATLGLWLLTLYGASTHIDTITLGIATISGALLSMRFLSDFLWGPVAGYLSDRHGRWILILICGISEAGAFLLLATASSLGWTAAASLLLFLSATAFQVSLDATAGDIAPQAKRARTMSWYATSSDLGAAIGPLIGYLLGAGIGLEWIYRGASILVVIVGAIYVFTFRFAQAARPVEQNSGRFKLS